MDTPVLGRLRSGTGVSLRPFGPGSHDVIFLSPAVEISLACPSTAIVAVVNGTSSDSDRYSISKSIVTVTVIAIVIVNDNALWSSIVWHVAQHSTARHGTACHGIVLHCISFHGMVWYGMLCYLWYVMA